MRCNFRDTDVQIPCLRNLYLSENLLSLFYCANVGKICVKGLSKMTTIQLVKNILPSLCILECYIHSVITGREYAVIMELKIIFIFKL